MSIYSTKDITRKEAEEMVRKCREIEARPIDIYSMTDEQLDEELHKYVYANENSGKYSEAVGYANNYMIIE